VHRPAPLAQIEIPGPFPLAIRPAATKLPDTVKQGTQHNAEIRKPPFSYYIFDSDFDVIAQSKPAYPRQGAKEIAALHTWVDFGHNAQF